jgi:hypothetical protein
MVLKQLFGGGKKNSNKTDSVPAMESPEKEVTAVQEAHAEVPAGAEPSTATNLEAAMMENARNDNADNRYKVYQELLFSDLLLALTDNAEATPPADGTVNVAILTNPQNVKFAAAFTSAAATKRWRPEGGNYVTIRGQDLFKLLEPSPAEVVVINAGGAPFIILPKLEYRQLAAGIIPQSAQSPVQMASAPQEPQVAFPADVLSPEQRKVAHEMLSGVPELDAAAFGVVLPPGAKPEDGWLRTLFVRVKDTSTTQEQGQALMESIHKQITGHDTFKDMGFQLVHVGEAGLWGIVAANNAALFDHNPPPPAAPQSEQAQGTNQEIQLAFPPDVFSPEQKGMAKTALENDGRVEAATIGAILPPGANKETGWVRTVFLRLKNTELGQDDVQKLCVEIRDSIRGSEELFKETGFEVGVMPDPNFWAAMTQEKLALFDRNPPPVQKPQPAVSAGENLN